MSDTLPTIDEQMYAIINLCEAVSIGEITGAQFNASMQEAEHQLEQLMDEQWNKIKTNNMSTYPAYDTPVIARLEWASGKETYAVLKNVNEDDHNWQTYDDNSELSFNVNVTHWKMITPVQSKHQEES